MVDRVSRKTTKRGPYIYVEVTPELLAALDGAVTQERSRVPGMRVTRADIIRRGLWRSVADKKEQA